MHRVHITPAACAIALVLAVTGTARVQSAGAVRFDEFAPTTFSVITPDVRKLAAAWADVLGIAAPPVNQPEVVYPPVFEGDRNGRPTMVSMQMANMTLSMHQPPEGRNYWRQTLDAQGEALYRMNFRVHDLADQVAYFERKGGTLVIGDPAKVPYVNVNLWARYGVALELNGVAAGAPPQGPRPAAPAGSFAANPVVKIAFVVPDLDKAIADYADLFGLSAASAVRTNPEVMLPVSTGATARLARATLTFPNGVLLELNRPPDGKNVWQDHLRRHGRSIFSVGFRVSSVPDASAYLRSKGGVPAFGVPTATYAGFDFTSKLGTVIEIQQ
ncbi:MAG: VOC family protein [Vicinamibacterales bacterium]